MIVQTIIGVSGLMLLVLLMRRPVARHFGPRVAYALWLLPFARLIAPTIELPRSWIPDLFTRADPFTNANPVAAAPQPMTPDMLQAMLMAADRGIHAATSIHTVPVATLFPWINLIIGLWAFGCVAGLFWMVTSHHRHMRVLRRNSRPVPATLSIDIDRAVCLSGLSKAPEVRLNQLGDGPLICGLLRPMIILPRDFENRFTSEQRRLALLHEMLHVRRGDLWTASAMLAFRLINWPNPIVHWAWPRFRADQEAACDASVLRCTGETSRSDYAETLLTAVTTAGRAKPASGAGLTLSLHHPVKERLMTLGSKTNSTCDTTRWALGALLLAGTAISAPLSFADDQQVDTVETNIETPVKGKMITKTTARFIISDDDTDEHEGFEIRVEDGKRTIYRVDDNGIKTVVTEDELGQFPGSNITSDVKRDRFPALLEMEGSDRKIIVVETDEESSWSTGSNSDENVFVMGLNGQLGAGSNAARLHFAQSMLEMTNRMLEDVQEDADDADRNLRSAEKELEKARKALEKALAAIKKSETR